MKEVGLNLVQVLTQEALNYLLPLLVGNAIVWLNMLMAKSNTLKKFQIDTEKKAAMQRDITNFVVSVEEEAAAKFKEEFERASLEGDTSRVKKIPSSEKRNKVKQMALECYGKDCKDKGWVLDMMIDRVLPDTRTKYLYQFSGSEQKIAREVEEKVKKQIEKAKKND